MTDTSDDFRNIENITCWVVSEGLAGTENQCLGVAEALGVSPHVKRIKLREPWKTFSPWLGFEQWWSFDPPLYPPWPDLVLASGRKAVAAARFIKDRTGGTCKTVFIQDPRISPKNFDLVAVPYHDMVHGSNVVRTVAAPNRITPEKLSSATRQFAPLKKLKTPRLAVLIGGDSKTHSFTESRADALIAMLQRLDASLMITLSRRTPEHIARKIRSALSGDNIYIWDGRSENPYFAFLGLADYILVTGDSASMISEAATTGKPVYKFDLEGCSEKFDRLYGKLEDLGILKNFSGVLEHWDYKPLCDAQIVAKAIRTLFIPKTAENMKTMTK